MRLRKFLGLTLAATAAVSMTAATTSSAAGAVPTPDHVVIVLFENHQQPQVIDSPSAPYITSLSKTGANFTQSYAVTHPSQPNYLAQFSGSTQGVSNDSCPHTFTANNLGKQLVDSGRTFAGYSEGLPSTGYTGCSTGKYARKHAPWVNFSNLATSTNKPYTAFPSDYSTLPTVSYVIPDLCNDMHDCSVSTGDTWLKNNLKSYADWAATHNSLLVVDFDEDDFTTANRIPTVFYGQPVKPGDYSEKITHYSVLRTIEDMYGLTHLGNASSATSITDSWQ
ncbi:alkaline phosphatase family protein [Amycolatopsis sp. H20-H5]|uniref:alkaline phosphatase family protein n=1 Tax=Amycolatopsis sp. H20-H5 TaxID=3046309 RepID=UPI002DBF7F9C|nr:alkaline phosphatase family protein [Amycolatopsis sp. H20-H5]MEC3979959.1 alkaline phosphatase family protein [Amycolatopsis sp. H20-H5]